MTILGCVLAGGQATRFGSDKALAMLNGETLMDRAIAALSSFCSEIVVAGRTEASVATVPDWPKAGLGPLGGLAGALRHARDSGFSAVLTCGVDSVNLPSDLLDRLSPGPACAESQPVIGLWPVSVLPVLEEILTGGERRSVLHFAERAGARLIDLPEPPANVNTREDLDRLRQG